MKLLSSVGIAGAATLLALGAGAGPALAAPAAPGVGEHTIVDLGNGQTEIGFTPGSPAEETLPPGTEALRCWDAVFSGRVFAVSCSGDRFFVYAVCSNNQQLTVGPLSGSKRVTITCPVGTRAVRGGAYGS